MSNIQTGAERMPHDLSHLGFLAGQIGRLITISRSEERFSRNAETDLVCRLLLEKKKKNVNQRVCNGFQFHLFSKTLRSSYTRTFAVRHTKCSLRRAGVGWHTVY